MSAHTPEVQALLDRQEIIDCLHRYRRGIDRHDNELLISAFHEDAIDHHGDFIGTTQEFVDWAAELHVSSSWAAHLHYLDCTYVELDGDVAHSECYVLFVHRRTDGTAIEFGGGRYIDRFERRKGAWKIAARQLLI